MPQMTPLWLACWSEAWDSALLLLARGADPNKAGRYSSGYVRTTLYLAAWLKSTAVCRRLLASGARMNIGETASLIVLIEILSGRSFVKIF